MHKSTKPHIMLNIKLQTFIVEHHMQVDKSHLKNELKKKEKET